MLDHSRQEMLDGSGQEGPAAPILSQAAISTVWEEKNTPDLQQDFSPYIVLWLGTCLEPLEGGRALISFVQSPALDVSLNLDLPGLCCKVTAHLFSASSSLHLHYQFLRPLISCLQQEPGYLP